MKGFTLLEVLIALLILSIGLLGFARAQLISLRHNETAYQQSTADIQNSSLAERIRACDANYSPACVGQQINTWQSENKTLLPQTKSDVVWNGDRYTITLKWQSVGNSNTAILQVPL